MKPVLVLYHANCRDGFGAAYAAWRSLGEHADYTPVQYGSPAPGASGRDAVFILDFSYSRAELLDMAKQCGQLVVVDHHASAERALAGINGDAENIYCIFDTSHSGAVLAWSRFHSGEPPLLLQYVQDRDLWRKELPQSEEVALGLGCVPVTFEAWDAIVRAERDGIEQLAQNGRAIRMYLDMQIATLSRRPPRRNVFGHDVPCVNAPGFLASDLGNALAQGEPFAVTWFATGDKVVASLRSTPDGLDVSELAALAGGGGHPHAAGFTAPLGAWPPFASCGISEDGRVSGGPLQSEAAIAGFVARAGGGVGGSSAAGSSGGAAGGFAGYPGGAGKIG